MIDNLIPLKIRYIQYLELGVKKYRIVELILELGSYELIMSYKP